MDPFNFLREEESTTGRDSTDLDQVGHTSFFGFFTEKLLGRKGSFVSQTSTRASGSLSHHSLEGSESSDSIGENLPVAEAVSSDSGYESVADKIQVGSSTPGGVKKTLRKTRSFGFRPRSNRTRNSFQQDLHFESGREWKETRERRAEVKRLEEEEQKRAQEHLDGVLQRSTTPTTPSRSPVFRSLKRSESVLSSGVPPSPKSSSVPPRWPSLKFSKKPYSVPCRRRDEPINGPEDLDTEMQESSGDESEKHPVQNERPPTNAIMD